MILFISDLHLSAGDPALGRQWAAFSSSELVRKAQALYVLGDLFDAWPGDDAMTLPWARDICQRLRELSDQGVALHFLMGNRDFLVGEAFLSATGCTLLPDSSIRDIAGEPTALLHGDLLCTEDVDYLKARNLLRSEVWQKDFLARPLTERQAIFADYRQRSESEKSHKDAAIMDASDEEVARVFRHLGVSHMIHGHTHRPACHQVKVDDRDCLRWVLPAWDGSGGGYLACTPGEWRLESFSA